MYTKLTPWEKELWFCGEEFKNIVAYVVGEYVGKMNEIGKAYGIEVGRIDICVLPEDGKGGDVFFTIQFKEKSPVRSRVRKWFRKFLKNYTKEPYH